MMRISAFALATFLVLGCGSSSDDGHDDAAATLTVDPPTSELLIIDGTPAKQSFTATLTYPNGDTRDVTGEVQFSIDTGYGTFADNELTARSAGKAQVFASFTDKVAVAQVLIRLKNVRVDPSLPPGAADWFTQLPEDPARAPTIVYPPAGSVMPRNLGDFEVHWTDAQNTVFEVSLKTELTDVRVIAGGGNGVVANGSWLAFLADEWAAAVGNEGSVQFQVRGVDANNPTAVGSATPELVQLSNEAMLGGLYYWASNGGEGIFRHDMSKPGQPPERFYTRVEAGQCVACHVLSRDGTRMAITYKGGNEPATFVDVATVTPQTSTRGWNFGAFTPDGSKFLAVQNGTLTVLDYATQATIATMTASGAITHPDLSADGTKLVYVQKSGGSDWDFAGGKIFIRTFDSATNTFGPEQMLVSDTNNNYYPSFSPDGKWVLFNRAASGTAYNNGNATLWVIPADASTPAIELLNANAGLGLTNSWGRWAPFQQTLGAANEPMYWVTVSSTRDFGVRLVGVKRPQIWMTPFFPDKAAASTDPSHAAFRLPFQNLDSNNHIAQWTEQIVTPL